MEVRGKEKVILAISLLYEYRVKIEPGSNDRSLYVDCMSTVDIEGKSNVFPLYWLTVGLQSTIQQIGGNPCRMLGIG